jgi:hypothetical protein
MLINDANESALIFSIMPIYDVSESSNTPHFLIPSCPLMMPANPSTRHTYLSTLAGPRQRGLEEVKRP